MYKAIAAQLLKKTGYVFLLALYFGSSLHAEEFWGLKELTLPSGNIVNVITPLIKMNFVGGGHALRFRYVTRIDLKDKASLEREAIEIWDKFIFNVEEVGYRTAIIAAYEPWEGDFQNNKHSGYMFRLEKQDNGKWVQYVGDAQ